MSSQWPFRPHPPDASTRILLGRALQLARAGQFDLDLATGRWTSCETLDRILGIGRDFPRTIEGWASLIPQEERSGLVQTLETSLRGDGPPFDHIYRIRTADAGEERWLHGIGDLELDQVGQPVRFFGLIQDVTEGVRQNRDLQERSGQLSTIIDGARLGTWDWHIPSGEVAFNERWSTMLGFEPGEVRPHVSSWEALVHPDDAAMVREALQAHLAGRTALYSTEHRILQKDGTPRWILDVGRVTEWGAGGQPVRAAGIHLDIDLRKRSAVEAQENLAKYRALLETEALGVSVTDTAGNVLEANSAAQRILGLPPGQPPSRNIFEPRWTLIRPDGSPFPIDEHPGVIALLEGRAVHGVEIGLFRTDGSLRWLVLNASPIESSAYGALLTYTDITDLRETEARYRAVFDSIHEMVMTLDRDLRHTGVYGNWLEEAGVPEEEFLGRTATEVLGPRAGEVHRTHSLRALAGEHVVYEWEYQGRRGLQHIQTSVSPIRDHQGQVTGLVAVGRDVTERVELEAARREVQARTQALQKAESLALLAGGVAHDFNNLLMGVVLNAELARLQLPSDAPVADLVQDILESGRQAAELAGQMLAYSGKARFCLEEVDPVGLLREILPSLQRSLPGGVEIRLALTGELPRARMDPTQFGHVLHRVVTNAAEALEGEGVVEIEVGTESLEPSRLDLWGDASALSPGKHLAIRVRDRGHGMTEEVARRAFEPFFSTRFTGRGLGLAACEGILRGHGGGILFETRPGEGTTFHLLFPAVPAPAAAPPVPGIQEESPTYATILLVDDEELVRKAGSRLLSRLGYRVVTAADGEEALEVYQAHRDEVDLVLMDVVMPGLDGPRTLARLRQEDPEIKVILMSGYHAEPLVPASPEVAPDAFLAKPFQLRSLQGQLDALLGV